jgi:hypothetical protein
MIDQCSPFVDELSVLRVDLLVVCFFSLLRVTGAYEGL